MKILNDKNVKQGCLTYQNIMKTNNRQSGFSLLEVMMAVVVLMMGMVFVSSMFPVGLHNSRQNVERTINAIESHNAAIMAEMMIDSNLNGAVGRLLDDYGPSGTDTLDSSEAYDYIDQSFFNELTGGANPNQVHFIPRPNIMVGGAGNGSVVIADFEYEYNITTYYNLTEYAWDMSSSSGPGIFNSKFKGDQLLPFSLLASNYDPLDGVTFPQTLCKNFSNYEIKYISSFTSCLFLKDFNETYPTSPLTGDIGRICCPVVDENHPEVIELAGSYDPYDIADRLGQLYPAIYKVALKQKYTWAVAYSERKDKSKPFDLSIFILKQGGDNARYAVQNPETSVVYNPDETYRGKDKDTYIAIGKSLPDYLNGNYDCRFPVPWLVYVDYPVYNTNSFVVNSKIADILRPGSVLIDADPQYVSSAKPTDTFEDNNSVGGIFRVKDIKPETFDVNGNVLTYKVTLQTNLNDGGGNNYLFAFWVFPPAIDRTTGEFMDEQPVIDVIQKKYWR